MTTKKHSWEIFSPLAYLSLLASCYDSVTCYHVPASWVPRLMLPPILISVWPRHGMCLLLSDANLSELLTCDIYCSKHFFFRGYISASSLVTSHCGLLEPNSWILVFNQRCFVLTPLLRCIVRRFRYFDSSMEHSMGSSCIILTTFPIGISSFDLEERSRRQPQPLFEIQHI